MLSPAAIDAAWTVGLFIQAIGGDRNNFTFTHRGQAWKALLFKRGKRYYLSYGYS